MSKYLFLTLVFDSQPEKLAVQPAEDDWENRVGEFDTGSAILLVIV